MDVVDKDDIVDDETVVPLVIDTGDTPPSPSVGDLVFGGVFDIVRSAVSSSQ